MFACVGRRANPLSPLPRTQPRSGNLGDLLRRLPIESNYRAHPVATFPIPRDPNPNEEISRSDIVTRGPYTKRQKSYANELSQTGKLAKTAFSRI